MTKLDRTWKNCLRMWKWISKRYDGSVGVETLKRMWMREHRFTKPRIAGCFFCDYTGRDKDNFFLCEKRCPGKTISSRFDCQNKSYDYQSEPKRFYAKLLELDAKRKKQK